LDEEEAAALLERVEARREELQLEEFGRPHTRARESLYAAEGSERDDPVARAREVEDPSLVRLADLLPLLVGEGPGTERRREGDDRPLDSATVEEREARLERVRADVDLHRRLAGKLQGRAVEPRRAPAPRKELEQRLRPEVLVDVDDGHAVTLDLDSGPCS